MTIGHGGPSERSSLALIGRGCRRTLRPLPDGLALKMPQPSMCLPGAQVTRWASFVGFLNVRFLSPRCSSQEADMERRGCQYWNMLNHLARNPAAAKLLIDAHPITNSLTSAILVRIADVLSLFPGSVFASNTRSCLRFSSPQIQTLDFGASETNPLTLCFINTSDSFMCICLTSAIHHRC